MFTRLDYSSDLEYSIIRRYTNIVYYNYNIIYYILGIHLENKNICIVTSSLEEYIFGTLY